MMRTRTALRTASRAALPALLTVLLGGCAVFGRGPAPATVAAEDATAATPPAWQAPLPHQGSLTDLSRWWQQFDDPLLSRLIDAAQAAAPTIASAAARIEQARATGVAAGAALLPSLDASASISRGRADLSLPLATSRSVGLQTAWEADLFGGNRAAREAALARFDGAAADWHAARISVAAEVASDYIALRACEAQVVQNEIDATSRGETSRLTALAARAGFQPPSNTVLAQASAAQARATLTQQRAQCDLQVKALVALTAIDEPTLRQQLAARTAQLPQPAQIDVASVPAQALAQRPDVYSAAHELLAAGAEVDQAQAARLPRILLTGSIAASRVSTSAGTLDGQAWSVGPVTVTLPLFDGGTRRAQVDAARARYAQARVAYRAQLRTAVREVEEALVSLHSTAGREADVRAAAEGYAQTLGATEARYRGGMGSLFELEEARRSAVLAQSTQIELQRERVAAWIVLYRSLGGGWTAAATDAPASP